MIKIEDLQGVWHGKKVIWKLPFHTVYLQIAKIQIKK